MRRFAAICCISALVAVACTSSPNDVASTEVEQADQDDTPMSVPDASPDSAVGDAAQQTLDSGSARTEARLWRGTRESVDTEIRFVETAIFDGSTRVRLLAGGDDDGHFHYDAGDAYMSNSEIRQDLGEGAWLHVEQNELVEGIAVSLVESFGSIPLVDTAFGGRMTASFLEALAEAHTASVLGRDIVDGLPTTRYMAHTNHSSLGNETVVVEVWIGDDGLIHQMETILTGTERTTAMYRLSLSEHGTIDKGSIALGSGQIVVPDNYDSAQEAHQAAQEQEELAIEEWEQRFEGEEEMLDERRRELEATDLSPEQIHQLASSKLVPIYGDSLSWFAFISHPGTGDPCWVTEYRGGEGDSLGFSDGTLTAECEPLAAETDLNSFCPAVAELGQLLEGYPSTLDNVRSKLDTMRSAWLGGRDAYSDDVSLGSFTRLLSFVADTDPASFTFDEDTFESESYLLSRTGLQLCDALN